MINEEPVWKKQTQLKFKNGIYDNPDSIRKGWAEYFEELATPSSSNYEDVLYNNQVDGKAADCANLTSEHLKNGGQIVISAVTKLINMIFDVCSIPDLLKLGIATPVYKRKGKPLDDPNSYRKITVTSILNKILEKLYLEKKDETLKNAQSPLQRGFTKGISGLNAALILNELIAEAQDMHMPLYVAFLDAQKAFDLVWHSSLLRKLHQSGIESDSWLMFKEWYKDLTSQIKWEGELSKHLPERTADSATYLLSGQMPIEAEIDKRTLTLFGNIIRNLNTVEFKLAQRQLAIKDRNSKSWFTYVQQLLEKYNLPSSSVLLQEPPGKFSWKNLVSKAVKTYWTNKIHSEALTKQKASEWKKAGHPIGKQVKVARSNFAHFTHLQFQVEKYQNAFQITFLKFNKKT
ncbi:unnamed protein product [Mytilus edulis]|uniref:Reverse transcriptase domain-containing protein n=1 Tax=Mytilus edulis TaxID=6550 RepID=A0A8S3UMM2_MYTED|nr:unnamed protein product [Mytilus edulis]